MTAAKILSPVCRVCGVVLPAEHPEDCCPDCLAQSSFVVDSPPPSNPRAATTGDGAVDQSHPAPLKPAATAKPEAALGNLGRFQLLSVVGEGASGVVYRALDPMLQRHVAVKTPRFASNDPKKAERFLREARAVARLRHPNIAMVFDCGQDKHILYIASEFIDGENFEQRLAKSPPALRQSVEWVRDAARGLEYAHQKGVVHRDVKPANLMLGMDDRVVVTDFGIARKMEDASTLTADGSVLGTPAYMSPEQARGDNKAVNALSDQYGLGVVLFELLTGRRPFEGTALQVLSHVVNKTPPLLTSIKRDIPPDLQKICLRAMAKSPNQRYAATGDFADDLDRWLRGKQLRTPLLKQRSFTIWLKRVAIATGVVVVGVAVAAFFLIDRGQRDRTLAVDSRHESESLIPPVKVGVPRPPKPEPLEALPAPPEVPPAQPSVENKKPEPPVPEIQPLAQALAAFDLIYLTPQGQVTVSRADASESIGLFMPPPPGVRSLQRRGETGPLIGLSGNRILKLGLAPPDETIPLHTFAEPAHVHDIAVHPREDRFAWCRRKPGSIAEIILSNLNDANETSLGFGYDPLWSHDGTKLIYTSESATDPWVIAIRKGDDTVRFPVPVHPLIHVYPVLSPDGQWLAFSMKGEDGTMQIGVMTIGGKEIRQLTRIGDGNGFPVFSPDGRFIAFQRGIAAPATLIVIEVETGQETIVANNAQPTRPIWSLTPPANSSLRPRLVKRTETSDVPRPVPEPREIREDTVLEPGDIAQRMVIKASNITIDGKGAWLLGGDGSPKSRQRIAILADGVSNVTLKNINAKGWETGLKVSDGEGWTIENCDFSDNFHDPDFGWGENGRRGGIVLERVNKSTLRKNKANRVWDGCVLVNSDDNVLEDNDFSHASNTCLKLWTSSRNVVKKNILSHGIRISPGEVHARDSTSVLVESGSNGNRFHDNDCTHGGDGIFVRVLNGWCSTGNRFEGNDCSFANNNGFECWAPRNIFEKNKANHCSYGFWLGGSDQTRLIGNEASFNGLLDGHHNSPHLPNNGHAGIVFMFGASSHTVCRGNTCVGNNGAGIALIGDIESQGKKWKAYHWILEDNKLQSNRWGIYAQHADWLVMTGNDYRDNSIQNVKLDGNVTRVSDVPKKAEPEPIWGPPNVVLKGPSAVMVGQSATWSVDASRGSGTEVLRSDDLDLVWDVGDGEFRKQPELRHTFDRVGFHRIGLNATYGGRTALAWKDVYVIRNVVELGTEAAAANWSIEDFHDRTRSNEQTSRAIFKDDEFDRLVGKSALRVVIRPYAGFRAALTYPKSRDATWSLEGKTKLTFWLKAINEDVTGWQGGPFITLYGDGEQRCYIEPKAGLDLMRQAEHNEAREGWRLLEIPLRGNDQWQLDGDLPSTVRALSLAFDSWGAPTLRFWIDGLALE